ncbi:hypothetical protein MPTK1_4g22330 [Marchantia polymorpha subsp. ruderalis]|nr:hypothetical protein MARPO_0020s0003 [Marchantia polymorpha]BBN09748.1 hypothetical protein Mp_4g22330 [Marchantia polymorpha subsp. ruderalis]|eukprot:PTQ44329.1 hypothetical protein MARPO_0020s0003 [Marchantia polymorpha]
MCPCLISGRIGNFLDDGNTSCTTNACYYCLFWCCVTGRHRRKLRKTFNLPEEPMNDYATAFFCHCCALCQESRELTNQGLDMGFNAVSSCGSPTCLYLHSPGEVEMHKH